MFLVRDTTKNRVFALKRILVNSQVDLENCKQEILIMVRIFCHLARSYIVIYLLLGQHLERRLYVCHIVS